MNEAPVATIDAPVDRKLLLFIVLMAGMITPFVGLSFSNMEQAVLPDCPSNSASLKEVSNPQNGGWDREVNWCVSTAWRMFCTQNKEYRSPWRNGLRVYIEAGQFLAEG